MADLHNVSTSVRVSPEEAASIGLEGPDFDFPIELGKVCEYGRSIRSDYHHPSNLSASIPVFYLSTAGHFWGYTFENPEGTPFSDVDIDRSLLLLASMEVSFPGEPPKVGDHLIARSKVESSYRKRSSSGGRLTFVVITTDFKDRSGRLVAVERSTLVKSGEVHADC